MVTLLRLMCICMFVNLNKLLDCVKVNRLIEVIKVNGALTPSPGVNHISTMPSKRVCRRQKILKA